MCVKKIVKTFIYCLIANKKCFKMKKKNIVFITYIYVIRPFGSEFFYVNISDLSPTC